MEHNNYLLKAIDAYPYYLEEAVESLNYALSYEPDNPLALSLSGRVYSDIYKNYEMAIEQFEKVLAEDISFVYMYEYYIAALEKNEDYYKALRFIDHALTVKSSDKAMLHYRKSLILECLTKYNKALASIKLAIQLSNNNDRIGTMKNCKKRIKKKKMVRKKSKCT